MARLSRARAFGLATGLLLLGGCGAEREFWVWPMVPDGTRAVLVAAELESAVRVRAFEFNPELPIEVDEMPKAITLFTYPQDLETLGLSPGVVEAAESGECWARPIALDAAIRHRSLEDAEWTELARAPAPLDALLVRAKCPCPRFEEEAAFSFGFAMNGRPRFASLTDALYFVSYFGSVRFPGGLVTEESAEVLEPNPVAVVAVDVFAAPDQNLWLAAGYGIYELDLDGGPVRSSTEGLVRPAGLDGGLGVEGLEVFVAADEGRVYQRRAGRWSELEYDPGITVPDSDQTGRVLWYEPGHAIVAVHDARALLSITPGREPELIPRENFPSVANLATAADRTIYLGAKTGPIGIFDGREIAPLPSFDPRLDSAGEIRRLFPVGDRMGFVAELGYLGEVVPKAGVCPLATTPGFAKLFDGIGDEAGTVIGGVDADGNLRIARYRRVFD